MSDFQYSKVSECVWMDDGFQGLSLEARYVWFYLLTNPAKKSMGIYRMPVAGMAAEAGMEEGAFRTALGEVVSAGMVSVDERKHVVVIWKYLVHNRPANGNIVRSWKGVVKGLPECALVDEYLQWVKGFMAGLGAGFVKGFAECLGNRLGNGLGNGIGEGIGNGTATLLTLNSDLKTPLTPLSGGTPGGKFEEAEGSEGEEEAQAQEDAVGDVGEGAQEGAAQEGGTLEVVRKGRRGRRGKRSGAAAGEDPLAGLSVLSEAHGVFRERLVGVHGARATLVDPVSERGVLRRIVDAGFEERDVVAILKWVLWEEVPERPGGFCWRDQFRSFAGLVRETRAGEWKFKGMAAGYEAWARSLGGVAVKARGGGGVVSGQGSVVGGERGDGQGEGEEAGPVRRWVAV